MAAINLSVSEAKLMAAVFSQMSVLPEADYDEVARIVGIKYARNARASFKKLFDRVKASSTSNGSGEDSDSANENKDVKATAVKKAKKAGLAKANGVTKKAPVPRAKAPRKVKKEVKQEIKQEVKQEADDEDEDDGADSSDMEGNVEEDNGKFINNFNPINGRKSFGGNKAHKPKTGYQVSVSGNEVDTAGDEEEHEAQCRGMNVEDWRAWKLENNYDGYNSHAPTPVLRYLSEEAV